MNQTLIDICKINFLYFIVVHMTEKTCNYTAF